MVAPGSPGTPWNGPDPVVKRACFLGSKIRSEGSAMLRVGLTGGIGSGKSAVSERLAALGAVVLDGDKAARAVVEPGTPGLARITEAFGPGVLRADGSLDRAALAAIVFTDDEARATLNAITHPLVHQYLSAAEEAAIAAGGPDTIVVHDIPLLAEGQRASGFDLVLVVDVPPELQVARLAGRGMPGDQARARMAAQATREQRLAIAGIVIDNSGTLADLDRRVGEVWGQLLERAKA
jgi:dephospho-CoA kinase